jgi:protein TonB
MAQTLGVRATSVMASALLLGAVVIAALSAKMTLEVMTLVGPPPVPTVIEAPTPPKPPPPIVREAPPEAPVTDEPFTPASSSPPNSQQPPTQTLLPYAPPSGPPEITHPQWLRRPSNLAVYYPQRAVSREVEGEVLLDCRVLTTGHLSCSILSETPESYGFGQAALRIARDHRMSPAMRDGVAIEGRYRMRVPFELR